MNTILSTRAPGVDRRSASKATRAVLALGFIASWGVAACGVGNRTAEPPTTVVIAPAASVASVASAAAPVASAVPAASASGASIKTDAADAGALCGCALCKPLVSDDACTKDEDCAPSTPCHAPACIAKAKAKPREKGTVCTMMLACGSADSNACGCVAGRCTLHARE